MIIHDVARKLGVSVATISRALNPATAYLVAEKTRRRILDYVSEVGYVPNRTARELSTGRTRTIGIVLPNFLESIYFNDYLVKSLGGIYHVLERHNQYNCKIIILPKGKVLTHIDQQVLASGIDGLLLSPYSDPLLYSADFPKALLNKWSQPVVLLNLDVRQHKRFNSVYCNHYDAARKAVTYLIQKGHKNIAMIIGDAMFPEANVRLDGYKKAMADHRLTVSKASIAPGRFTIEGGYEAALSLMRENTQKPTAIFCANDEMAIGALRALKALGVRCPQDVAVMGYDGIDLGEYVEPRLTSVQQPTRLVAEQATEMLLGLIEGRLAVPQAKSLPSEIIVRDSA